MSIDQGPNNPNRFTFGNSRKDEMPHAGGEHVPEDVREQPVPGAIPVTETDSLAVPDVPPATPADTAVADQARQAIADRAPAGASEKKWYQHTAVKVGGAALGLLGTVSTVGGLYVAHKINEAMEPLKEPGVSAPVVPGEDGNENEPAAAGEPNFTPDVAADPERDSDPSYEEARTPGVLTPEQVADWNSGDPEKMNAVASDVLAPRIGVAAYDAEFADKDGVSYNWASVTSDPAVIDYLNTLIVGKFRETREMYDTTDTELWGYDVCRTNVDYDPNLSRCAHNETGHQISFINTDDGSIYIMLGRVTSTDPSAHEQKAYRMLKLDPSIQARLMDNGTLQLVKD